MANFSPYLRVVLGVEDLGSISCEVPFPEFGEGFFVVCMCITFFPPDLLVSDISQPSFLEPNPVILMFNLNFLPRL